MQSPLMFNLKLKPDMTGRSLMPIFDVDFFFSLNFKIVEFWLDSSVLLPNSSEVYL